MATILGPTIQVPSPDSSMFEFSYDDSGKIIGMTMTQGWAAYLQSVQMIVYAGTRSGPSASRPTSTMPGRYTGMPFFDTDLGLPVFLKTASTNVWVNGAGAPV